MINRLSVLILVLLLSPFVRSFNDTSDELLVAYQLTDAVRERTGNEEVPTSLRRRLSAVTPLSTTIITQSLRAAEAKTHVSCGSGWQATYSQFQKQMLTGPEESIRRLVFMPNLSGMADRLIGMTTAFMVAMLTNRVFQVAHRSPLPSLSIAFDSPNIHWNRTESPTDEPDWIVEPLMHKAKQRNYNDSILSSKTYYAVNTIDDWKLQDQLLRQPLQSMMGGAEVRTSFLAINRGKTIRMFENSHHTTQLTETGLTSASAFGCLLSYLVQPKPQIFQLLPVSVFETMTNSKSDSVLKIAIQIRAGDWALNDAQHAIDLKAYSAFFSCAQQIEDRVTRDPQSGFKSAIWYLVSDSLPLRMKAVEEYGSKKIVTSLLSVVEHSSKEGSVCQKSANSNGCAVSEAGLQTAAAEWWLMKFATYHVISEYSGYGRSAAMHGFASQSIFTVPHNKAAQAIVCDAKSNTPLEDLPYYWSGI